MKYNLILPSIASVIFPIPSTQKITLYEDAELDLNKVASILNQHNCVCKNKIDWEWTNDDKILLHSVLPSGLMYLINECVL